MKSKDILHVIAAIIIAELAGIIGSIFTSPAIPSWYAGIIKPEFSPPNWIFGPVWTTLFLLMGIASYLIWRKGWENKNIRYALGIYGVQLVLNTLWSFFFFGLESPGLGLIEIGILWVAILYTIVVFSKISKPAAWLLVPYILWVSFATILNFAIWRLN